MEIGAGTYRDGTFQGYAEQTKAGPRWTGRVQLVESALDWPLRWRGDKRARAEGRPSRVFVNSMSDLFHERLSDEEIAAVFGVMAASPQHVFQCLTKRPERALRWFTEGQPKSCWPLEGCINAASHFVRSWGDRTISAKWPLSNVWLGVSVEDQATADERIPLLLSTPASVRFCSYEPALGPVDFDRIALKFSRPMPGDPTHDSALSDHEGFTTKLDWLIVGGESGPGARPFDLAWARAVVEQCREAEVACFVKQLGAQPYESDVEYVEGRAVAVSSHDIRLRNRKGGDWSEWPEDLRVREFPITPKEP